MTEENFRFAVVQRKRDNGDFDGVHYGRPEFWDGKTEPVWYYMLWTKPWLDPDVKKFETYKEAASQVRKIRKKARRNPYGSKGHVAAEFYVYGVFDFKTYKVVGCDPTECED